MSFPLMMLMLVLDFLETDDVTVMLPLGKESLRPNVKLLHFKQSNSVTETPIFGGDTELLSIPPKSNNV